MMNIRKSVKAALDEGRDRPGVAVRLLVRRAARDGELRDVLLKKGADYVVRLFFSDNRRSALSMARGRVLANLDNPDVAGRVAARIARRKFWDLYTLFGMQSLKAATKDMLIESAGQRRVQGRTELRLAEFELALARRLAGRDTVGSKISASVVEKLAVKYGVSDDEK